MKYPNLLLPLAFVLVFSFSAMGQAKSKIVIPKLNDKYSELVSKAEAGDTDVDFREMRFALLDSKQYRLKA